MLSRTRNLPKFDGITLVPLYSWLSAVQGTLRRFKPLKPLIRKLANYRGGVLNASPFPETRPKSPVAGQKSGSYYVGYYTNATPRASAATLEGATSDRGRPKAEPYYDAYYVGYDGVDIPGRSPVDVETASQESRAYYENVYYITPVSHPASLSGQAARDEIERQWKGEIERYIKMGGGKDDFIDFIDAARTGFPDERDQAANEKVKRFRESFIDKASRDDILQVMELHSNIRARLEQSERDYLAKGDEQAYLECAGRISRLDRGKRQLQLVLKRKSFGLAA
jgi:hypothetical protein